MFRCAHALRCLHFAFKRRSVHECVFVCMFVCSFVCGFNALAYRLVVLFEISLSWGRFFCDCSGFNDLGVEFGCDSCDVMDLGSS